MPSHAFDNRRAGRGRRQSPGRAALVLLGLLGGCQLYTPIEDPDTRAMADMQAVIAAYQRSGARPVHGLDVASARAQPGFEQAIRAVADAQHEPVVPFMPARDLQVDGAAGPLPARLYDPTFGKRDTPLILYFHGGGWVTGGIEQSDLAARVLAARTHARVLSVAYRLAPEAKLPAAWDDAVAAYRWVLDQAGRLGTDRRRIAVAGTDAGANLAINVAIAARDGHLPPPAAMLLITPIAGTDFNDPSYIAFQGATPVGRPDMRWYFNQAGARLDDPRVDLIGRADLHGLPTATIISAEIDPLQSDGEFLTYKLQAAGNQVARTLYGGTVNGFFPAGAVVVRAGEAEDFAAQNLDAAFGRQEPAEAAGRPVYRLPRLSRGRAR